MEKNEHILYQDIPIKGKYKSFHSAILTTFSIDLIHLESHIRNELHRKKICSINVFADKAQIDSSLRFVYPSSLPHIGYDYTVSNVQSSGAFHPKINFFVGYESVLALIGSGNLTVTGHGKNHEAFTGFMIDDTDESQRPLIEELWHYITGIASKSGEYEKRRILYEIPDNCEYLDPEYDIRPHSWHEINDDLSAALLYNDGESSILMQIANLIPVEQVEHITIASPFFDEDGRTLLNLASLCPNSVIDVLIQRSCTLPPNKMISQSSIRFYDFDKTNRGKVSIEDYERLNHAKILHFSTNDTEYIVVGSANATTAGMGSFEERGCNDELCVFYSSKSIHFLADLGISPDMHYLLNNEDLPKRTRTNHESKSNNTKYTITSASYNRGILKVCLDKAYDHLDNTFVTLNNGIQSFAFESFDVANNVIIIKSLLEKCPLSCHIEHHSTKIDDTKCSNTVFVNFIDELNTTNPSRLSRELSGIIPYIENDGYKGLEVTDMLSSVMSGVIEYISSKESSPIRVSGNIPARPNEELPAIQYKAEYDNDDEPISRQDKNLGVSKLVVCIEESLKRKLHFMEEILNDEEEEANAETSNARSSNTDFSICLKDEKEFDAYCNSARKVLKTFIRYLKRRCEVCRATGEHLIDDDLSLFALSIFASVEICYLNRFSYYFDFSNSIDRSHCQKRLFEKFDSIMENEAFESLQYFANFCNCYHDKKSLNEELTKSGQRSLKYVLLYATFFFRFAIRSKHKMKDVCKSINNIITLVSTKKS